MNWKTTRIFFTLLFAWSLIAACSSSNPNNGAPVSAPAVEGICANDYYPVLNGATWTYKSTGNPAGDYKLTETISAVKSDGFTLTSQVGNQTTTQEWSCREGGLAAMQFGDPILETLRSQDMNFAFDFKQVDGVTLPAAMKDGDEWQHNLDFEGSMDIAGKPSTATGTAQTVYKMLGTESVNVRAGSFQAVKIQVNTNIAFTIKVQGIAVPASYSGTFIYWYAKGVGWVKAEGQGNITGTSFNETIELQSYKIQ